MEKAKNTLNYDEGGQSVVITLDLTGLKCPLPVLKARRQIGQMAVGDVLVVLADDPAAPLDFDHFCHTNGHQFLEITDDDSVFKLRIVKSAE